MSRTLERHPDGCLIYLTSQGWIGVTAWDLKSRPRRSRPRPSRDAALRWLNTERYLHEKREARNAAV